jgi:hypothetical protein
MSGLLRNNDRVLTITNETEIFMVLLPVLLLIVGYEVILGELPIWVQFHILPYPRVANRSQAD